MAIDFRCQCPISTALDIIGDKWILLIVRDMLFDHKKYLRTSQRLQRVLLPIFYPPD